MDSIYIGPRPAIMSFQQLIMDAILVALSSLNNKIERAGRASSGSLLCSVVVFYSKRPNR